LRLGLKIDRADNVKQAYAAFTTPEGVMDVWNFARMAEADFERIPQAGDKKLSPREKKMRGKTAASAKEKNEEKMEEKKVIGASTVVEVKPFG